MNTFENISSWQFDGWGHIQSKTEDAGSLGSPETAEKVIAKVRPLIEKYGLVMKDCDYEYGEIDIQNDVLISADTLDEFFGDFQNFLNILESYNLKVVGYSDRLIPEGADDDDYEGPSIAFSIDGNGKLSRAYCAA